MKNICSVELEVNGTLPDRMSTYIADRSIRTLAGPRRMGRGRLVETFVEHARGMGRRVMVVPGEVVDCPDMIVFDHWSRMDGFDLSAYPGVDVIYGQDLCHQVPAVVRAELR